MKIGLFFGSFNPIHVGHLIIANHLLNETNLEKLWFVVSPQNPFKKSATLLNEYHRLHLVQSAIADDNRLKASDIEFGLPKPSYTIDTLTYLTEKYPEQEFTVVMGSDSFQNLNRWKNYEAIINHYSIYVYLRPGFDAINNINAKLTIVNAPLLQLSATDIRNNIAAGKSVRYMLPQSVLDEIEKGGYYKNG